MKTVTYTERVGERVGDVDWNYDFLSHFGNLCTDENGKFEACELKKELLRLMEERFRYGRLTLATTDGGWPRFGYSEVIDVGMYDGWPFFRPVPSVCIRGPLGGSWQAFCTITEIIARD